MGRSAKIWTFGVNQGLQTIYVIGCHAGGYCCLYCCLSVDEFRDLNWQFFIDGSRGRNRRPPPKIRFLCFCIQILRNNHVRCWHLSCEVGAPTGNPGPSTVTSLKLLHIFVRLLVKRDWGGGRTRRTIPSFRPGDGLILVCFGQYSCLLSCNYNSCVFRLVLMFTVM